MFWQIYLPERIAFTLGSVSVHWYGLILVLAIAVALWYAGSQLRAKSSLSKSQIEDLFFYLIIAGLVGARLGHVIFFNLPYYINHPLDVVKIWQGGLSIHGAVLFGLIALYFWCKSYKVNIKQIADILIPALPLAQAIGRWGNYFNQELYGKATDSLVGIPIAFNNRVEDYNQSTHFQPTFFYEFVLNLILFFSLHKLLAKKLKAGLITLIYLAGYSIIRFSMEFIRIDETPVVLGMRLPQLISLVVIILVVILYLKYYLKPLTKR